MEDSYTNKKRTVALAINDKIIDKVADRDYQTTNSHFVNRVMTAEQLADTIKQGHALCVAGLCEDDDRRCYRSTENFLFSDIIGVDIDNEIKDTTSPNGKRRKTEEEGYLTVDDVKRTDIVKEYAFLVYTTPSHKEDHHRFRVIFKMEHTMRDAPVYQRRVKALIHYFGGDEATSSCVQIFYGSSSGTVDVIDKVLTDEKLQEIVQVYNSKGEDKKQGEGFTSGTVTKEQCAAMLACLPKKLDYLVWVKIISGVAKIFSEDDTVELIEAWSPGFPGEVRYRYRKQLSFVNFGTVVWHAKQYGWEAPDGFYDHSKSEYNMTDSGNAERFVDMFHNIIRYDTDSCHWFIWDGKKFDMDTGNFILQLAKQCVRTIYNPNDEALKQKGEDVVKRLKAFALRSENKGPLMSMVELAKSDKRITATSEDFNSDPYKINFDGFVWDLRTAEAYAHDPSFMMTKIINHTPDTRISDFDADVHCPSWIRFLRKIFENDESLIEYIRRAIAYSMSGLTDEQCFFFAYGSGANGKSVFFNMLERIGGEYHQQAAPGMFKLKIGDAISNDVARLRFSRIVVTEETEENKYMDEAKIKALTGGDKISARYLHKEYFEFKPTHKIWMYGNHKPHIKGTDNGIWRRLHTIPFNKRFEKHEARPQSEVIEEMSDEMPGILVWLLIGYNNYARGLQHNGTETGKKDLLVPEKVREATREYREEMNVVHRFLQDWTIQTPGNDIKATDMFKAFQAWTKENNESQWTSKKKFEQKMKELNYKTEHDSVKNQYVYRNVHFTSQAGEIIQARQPF